MRYHFGYCGGERLGQGNTASFEDWDRLVRQIRLRVHVDVYPGNYGDVASLFTASMANDPARESLGQLMQSIVDLVGADTYVSAADLFNEAKAKKTDFWGISKNEGQQTFLPITFGKRCTSYPPENWIVTGASSHSGAYSTTVMVQFPATGV